MSTEMRRLLSALALVLTLAAAWILRWDAGDLMWGAWASSAAFGWVYGVLLIISNPDEVDAPGGAGNPSRFLLVLSFFSLHFLIFHYGQGVFLCALFPPAKETSTAPGIFLYPAVVFPAYWPVISATFLSGIGELREAREPSEDTQRLLRPYGNIVRFQVLLFLFLFMEGMGLIRFAAYPFLVLYFFPVPSLGEKVQALFTRLDEFMNTPR